MQWVWDHTGRFRWRPYYRANELDEICERQIRRFLRARHSVVRYPIATDDLMALIEQEASDLDLCADLTSIGGDHRDVDGVTTFYRHQPPRVRIAQTLAGDPRREPRLRTTLAHELGHVLLHDFARHDGGWTVPDDPEGERPTICTPSVIPAGRVDWMEWQAGYASGALLMPREALWNALGPLLGGDDGTRPVPHICLGQLIDKVQGCFLVSQAAAFVRLRQLGYLSNNTPRRRILP